MNSEELYNEIFKDFEIVQRKATYLTDGLRREAIKSKAKHVNRIFDYKSKQLNKWFIVADYIVGHPAFILVVHYLDEYGFNGIRIDAGNQSLTHVTPHFLERYNERFLKQPNLSKLELLKRFIKNNPVYVIQSVFDTETKKYKISGRVNEGIVLGIKEVLRGKGKEINQYKTFISSDMIFENQADALNYLGEQYDKYWNELPNITRRCA
jgi:hypothetical protein